MKTLNYLCYDKTYDDEYRNHKIGVNASLTANAKRKFTSEAKKGF